MPRILTVLLWAAATLGAPLAYAMESDSSPATAAKADPDYATGKKAIAARDWPSAITALKAAAGRDSGNADIQNDLGYAYRNAGQLELALTHYEKALKLNPEHRGAREYLGELYLMQNKLAKAEEQRAALDKLCFFPCEELTELREKIAAYKKQQR